MSWDAGDVVSELSGLVPVSIDVDASSPEGWLWLVLSDDEDGGLASLGVRLEARRLTIVVALDPATQIGCDEHLAATLLVLLTTRLGGSAVDEVVLDTLEPIFRMQARRLGFEGPLRGPLHRPAWQAEGRPADSGRRADSDPAVERMPLGLELASLMADVEVTRRRRRGPIGTLTRSAASVVAGVADFDIVDLRGDRPPLRLTVLDRPGLLADNIAMAVDTVLAISRAFGAAAAEIRQVSFVRSMQGFRSGSIAGAAHLNLGHMDLNGAYVTAEGLRRLRGQGRAAAMRWQDRHAGPRLDRPAVVVGASSIIDGVAAHEAWHLIEAQFEARRYGESIELRREIGRYFGLDTLEHVAHGLGEDAPDALRTAQARLAQEVSGYATTNAREASAEMFKLWWCARAEPGSEPAGARPVVTFFDGALRRHFDVDLGDRRSP